MENPSQRKHIITIAGRPGSGKSTTSKAIAAQLGYEHFSTGDMFRAVGSERGLDLLSTNLAAENHKDIDKIVDEKQQELGATKDNLVIDARLAWHWMPYSFKVFLDLDLEVAAKRIITNTDAARLRHEHVPDDPHEYAQILQRRLSSEAKRYMNTYQANPYDTSNYDLVVDTGTNSIEEVVTQIIEAYNHWLKG